MQLRVLIDRRTHFVSSDEIDFHFHQICVHRHQEFFIKQISCVRMSESLSDSWAKIRFGGPWNGGVYKGREDE